MRPKPKSAGPFRCPSSSLELADKMFGIVGADGVTSYLSDTLPVPENIDPAQAYKLRFSTHCHGGSCGRWKDGECGLVGRVLEELDQHSGQADLTDVANETLIDCSIRQSCRWFRQKGGRACGACQYVVYLTEKPIGI